MKKLFVAFASMACLIVAGSVSAFAVAPQEVHISRNLVTIHGACCQDVSGEVVRVNEAAVLVPVVLTWSVQYTSSGLYSFGVRLNGGGCGDYGPQVMPTIVNIATPFTYQLVILPSDGLKQGTNTFQICVGALVNESDTIILGERTLAVRSSN
jgi:hypothetical protein